MHGNNLLTDGVDVMSDSSRVWEIYASLVLQHIDANTYSSLEYGERPDLSDRAGGLGIEVTRAIDKKSAEVESLYDGLLSEADEQRRKDKICQIRKSGGTVGEGWLIGPKGTDDFDLVLERFKRKTEKLNSEGFRIFEHNQLFIFSSILADCEMLDDALLRLGELCDAQYAFDRVFVSVPGEVYDFDLVDNAYSSHPVNRYVQKTLAFRANDLYKRQCNGIGELAELR